ncbi:hypothetical protein DL240_05495 [Lujinxingia litoralis]|uniref:Lipoprotein n=1 Tax=Lujinxingia litoralis TaxID=2211119 RepID=A0A328C9E4_9DELT|nr:hypothetical protein [Lujinxingia litoralis]RAL23614.1 hypothetical protein DL240_05495 [Lujinxingia litoralis]
MQFDAKKLGWPLLVSGALALGATTACSGDDGDQGGQACETNADCEAPNVCLETGICGVADEGDTGDEPVIEDEDYVITYVRSSVASGQGYELRLFATSDETHHSLVPESADCAPPNLCGVTQSLSHFVYLEQVEGGLKNVYVASIDSETLEVSGALELFVESVFDARVRGQGVAYLDGTTAYYKAIGGEPQIIGVVAEEGEGEESPIVAHWEIDPVSGRTALFMPTLETVDVLVGELGTPIGAEDNLVTISGANYPGEAGSYFLGVLPTAFSADGNLVAFLTVGPNDYQECGSNADCTGTAQQCGDANRCTAIEPTVNIIDISNADNLGEACSSDAECGPVHRCDTSNDDYDRAMCMPQRVAYGLPNFPYQGEPIQAGCAWTKEDGSFAFTDIDDVMSFGADGRLYVTASRECVRPLGDPAVEGAENNIPRSAITVIDPQTGTFEEIFGNLGAEDFDESRCYDELEQQVDITNCVTRQVSARLSPGGNDLIFSATNPNVVDPGLADRIFDMWSVKRNGEDPVWLTREPSTWSVVTFGVHPDPRAATDAE